MPQAMSTHRRAKIDIDIDIANIAIEMYVCGQICLWISPCSAGENWIDTSVSWWMMARRPVQWDHIKSEKPFGFPINVQHKRHKLTCTNGQSAGCSRFAGWIHVGVRVQRFDLICNKMHIKQTKDICPARKRICSTTGAAFGQQHDLDKMLS